MSLHLVLVEPAGPLNVGSVARLCANFGLDSLRLVAPRCDPLDPEARRMAVHGLPLLEGACRFASLAEALADCRRVVACTGRLEGPPLPLESPQACLPWLLAGQRAPGSATQGAAGSDPAGGLVFGREDRGLSNDELLLAGRLLTLSTDAAYTSLNLSHAVALVLHELHGLQRQGVSARTPWAGAALSGPDAAGPQAADPGEEDCCARGELEAALADAEALLLEVGYLYPHTARARMAKLRALLQRSRIRSPEVALLRGMVCQLRWASRRPCADGPRH